MPIPAGGFLGFSIRVPPASDLDSLTVAELKDLVLGLLAEIATLKQTVAAQREEIARLKGLSCPFSRALDAQFHSVLFRPGWFR